VLVCYRKPLGSDQGQQDITLCDLLIEMLDEIHTGWDMIDVDENVAFWIGDVLPKHLIQAVSLILAVLPPIADEYLWHSRYSYFRPLHKSAGQLNPQIPRFAARAAASSSTYLPLL